MGILLTFIDGLLWDGHQIYQIIIIIFYTELF